MNTEYVNFLNLEYFFVRLAEFLNNIGNLFFPTQCGETFGSGNNLLGFFGACPIYLFFTIISIFFIVAGIYLLLRLGDIRREGVEKFDAHFIKAPISPKKNKEWDRIQGLFESNNEADWRVAIIEADSMLDKLIVDLGYPGETMGERMKGIEGGGFPLLQNAWEAHKVRNRIAHEGLDYRLTPREAHYVYRLYESIFVESGLI